MLLFPCVHARKNLHHFLEQIDEFHMRYKTIKTIFNPRRCELRTRLHFTCSLSRQSFLHELTNYSLTEIMLVQSRRLNQQARHTNLLDTQHSFISFVSLSLSCAGIDYLSDIL